MKCDNCNVYVKDNHAVCPLCGKSLGVSAPTHTEYPSYKEFYKAQKKITFKKMLLFLSLCAIILTFVINYFTFEYAPVFWSGFASVTLMYAWVTYANTAHSKTHIGGKILFQVFFLSLLVITIDFSIGKYKWSTNYVVPFLCTAATFLLTILALVKKSRCYEYTAYLLSSFLLSLLPIVFFITSLSNVLWPSVATIVYSLITVIGLFVFSDKEFKAEIKKRFHF